MENATLDIEGMHCKSCSGRVEDLVSTIDGVDSISVSLEEGKAELVFDANRVTPSEVANEITKKLGFHSSVAFKEETIVSSSEESTGKQKVVLKIKGMHCKSCSGRVDDYVSGLEGVDSVQVSLEEEQGVIICSETIHSSDLGEKITEKLGFSAEVVDCIHLQEASLEIIGMHCGSCSARVEEFVKQIEGVSSINVALDDKKGTILFDPSVVSAEEVAKSVKEKFEYDTKVLNGGVQKAILAIKGMHCTSCTSRIEQYVLQLDGVLGIRIFLENEKGELMFNGEETSASDVARMITETLGFEASVVVEEDENVVASELNEENDEILERENMNSMSQKKKAIISISGMHCVSCAGRIEDMVSQIEGIDSVKVLLSEEKGEVLYDSSLVDLEDLAKMITEKLGFPTSVDKEEDVSENICEIRSVEEDEVRVVMDSEPKQMEEKSNEENKTSQGKVTLEIQGMHCTSCSTRIEEYISKLSGVEKMSVALAIGRGELVFDSDTISASDVAVCISEKLGYPTVVVKEEDEDHNKRLRRSLLHEEEIAEFRSRFFFCLFFSIPLLVIVILVNLSVGGLTEDVVPGLQWHTLIAFILATPVWLYGGWIFHLGAYHALLTLSANMDVLVSMGTSVAYIYSVSAMIAGLADPSFEYHHFFETAAGLITFILLGKYLENYSKGKTSEAIVKLIDLQPPQAVLVDVDSEGQIVPDSEKEVDASMIKHGDVMKIVPGTKASADGVVVFGESNFDESILSGESLPVWKTKGDRIIGGTMNCDGLVLVEADRVGSETTLAQMVRMMENAQSSKAPIQSLADRISARFVPVVMVLALLTFLIWMTLGLTDSYPESWRGDSDVFVFALIFGLTVLVIACPCALGLATPTAVLVGTGVGAKNGLLIKGGEAFEFMSKATYICFDKTGTLTEGNLTVTVENFYLDEAAGVSEKMIRRLLGSAESGSEHVIAAAVTNAMKSSIEEDIVAPTELVSVAGKGIQCVVDGHRIVVGNLKFFEESDAEIGSKAMLDVEQLQQQGNATVLCGVDGVLRAVLGLGDTLKWDAPAAVEMLRSMGIEVCMISGDSEYAATHMATKCGITDVVAQCSPGDKIGTIEKLQKEGHCVIHVGDGVNDAPALMKADVGVAIGVGTDLAVESANIVLMGDSLLDLITAVDLSRKTFRRIRENYVWALGYNCLAIPLAAGALFPLTHTAIPPMVGGLAMVLSSVSVVLSSLLLKRYKPPATVEAVKKENLQKFSEEGSGSV